MTTVGAGIMPCVLCEGCLFIKYWFLYQQRAENRPDLGIVVFNEASPVSEFCKHLCHLLIGLIKSGMAYSRTGKSRRDIQQRLELWERIRRGRMASQKWRKKQDSTEEREQATWQKVD